MLIMRSGIFRFAVIIGTVRTAGVALTRLPGLTPERCKVV
jgi:hypothetical protein